MKKFELVAAQGEITVLRIGGIPSNRNVEGFAALAPEGGKFVIGHSETGHHHVIGCSGADVMVMEKPPEGMRILRAILENPTALEHLRPHDTHETIMLEPGEYEFRVAREFDHYAELARRSAD